MSMLLRQDLIETFCILMQKVSCLKAMWTFHPHIGFQRHDAENS